MKYTRALLRIRLFTTQQLFIGYTVPAVTAILVLILLVLCVPSPTMAEPVKTPNSVEPEQESGKTPSIAATVNGVLIKLDDLDQLVDNELYKYKKYGVSRLNEDLLKTLQVQAVEKLISVELLYQEARKIKLEDLDERVEKGLSKLQEHDAENREFDPEKARQIITKKVLIEEYLIQNKLKDSEVPENLIKDYYENNKESFKRKMAARTRHILVNVAADSTPEEKAAARDKIERARKLILEGKEFAEIAKEYSDCNSAPGGGELGYREKGYMPQEYDGVAFSLEKGKLSDIVETKFGYHLIEVIDLRPAGVQPYEEVKDFIGRYLNIEHGKKSMEEHLSALRKKANVEIYL